MKNYFLYLTTIITFIYLVFCNEPLNVDQINSLKESLIIHAQCRTRSALCDIRQFSEEYQLDLGTLFKKKSFFIVIKPKNMPIEYDYLKEWEQISHFHKAFFNAIDIIIATVNCDEIESNTLFCMETFESRYNYITKGKLFDDEIRTFSFEILSSIRQPLMFVINTLKINLYRLYDFNRDVETSENENNFKKYVNIVDIKFGNESDIVEMMQLWKLENEIGDIKFISQISESLKRRQIKTLNGSCLKKYRKHFKPCIISQQTIPSDHSFSCEATLSLWKINAESNIVNISSVPNLRNNSLLAFLLVCKSIFMAQTEALPHTNLIQIFNKFVVQFPKKKTFLIFISRDQMRSIIPSEEKLIHFHKEASEEPIKFPGSITDEKAIENFFQFQFHLLENASPIRFLQNHYFEDLEERKNYAEGESEIFNFKLPNKSLRDRNLTSFIMEQIYSQNLTILVTLQKWISDLHTLSFVLQKSNERLRREIGIDNVYRGIDCFDFDKFCLSLGVVSKYPTFVVFKNGTIVKSFRNGQYSSEIFTTIAHLFCLSPIIKVFSVEEFRDASEKFLNVSDIMIIITKGREDFMRGLLNQIKDEFYGKFPVMLTNLSFLPSSLQNQVNNPYEVNVFVAHRTNKKWIYLKPQSLSGMEDLKLALNIALLYSPNALKLEDIVLLKAQRKRMLIHVNYHVDRSKVNELRQALSENITLKYIEIFNNEEIVKQMALATVPALVFVDFDRGKNYYQYENVWNVQHISVWMEGIMKRSVHYSFQRKEGPDQSLLKSRIYFENKILFGNSDLDGHSDVIKDDPIDEPNHTMSSNNQNYNMRDEL